MTALQPVSARPDSFSHRLRYLFKRSKTDAHKHMHGASMASIHQRSYMVMPGQPVWTDRNYAQFAEEAYVRNVIAHRAINMVAWAGASIQLIMYNVGAKGGKKEVKAHPLLDLLKRPNPGMAGSGFFHALYQYQMISGNVFIQATGPKGAPPAELYLLRPDRMVVLAGKGAMPAGYRYTINNQSVDFPVDRISGLSRILHLKTFHPLSDWYGLSPVEAAAYSIDQHNQSGAWNQSLLQNGARPSGALVVRADKNGGGSLSEDQYTRIKQQIDEQFTGATNAGRPILLEGGLDWKEMSMSPRDMDFIEAKHASARDIALAFGVPPQLLGIPGDNTYANLQEARLALWEQTVIPMVQNSVDALNSWVQGLFGDKQIILELDTDNVSALALRNQSIWDRVEKASFLSDDEKREAVGYSARKRKVAQSDA
jgi:HK97 family phage portal protein